MKFKDSKKALREQSLWFYDDREGADMELNGVVLYAKYGECVIYTDVDLMKMLDDMESKLQQDDQAQLKMFFGASEPPRQNEASKLVFGDD